LLALKKRLTAVQPEKASTSLTTEGKKKRTLEALRAAANTGKKEEIRCYRLHGQVNG